MESYGSYGYDGREPDVQTEFQLRQAELWARAERAPADFREEYYAKLSKVDWLREKAQADPGAIIDVDGYTAHDKFQEANAELNDFRDQHGIAD